MWVIHNSVYGIKFFDMLEKYIKKTSRNFIDSDIDRELIKK
jgi:hypothetical protein